MISYGKASLAALFSLTGYTTKGVMFSNLAGGGYVTPNGNVVLPGGGTGVVTPNGNVVMITKTLAQGGNTTSAQKSSK